MKLRNSTSLFLFLFLIKAVISNVSQSFHTTSIVWDPAEGSEKGSFVPCVIGKIYLKEKESLVKL